MNSQLDLALVFKALSDDNRIKIVDMLKEGERCACDILEDLHIVQSTLSHHMKSLCESGIVSCRKDGRWSYYSLNKEVIEAISNYFEFLESAATNTNEQCRCN